MHAFHLKQQNDGRTKKHEPQRAKRSEEGDVQMYKQTAVIEQQLRQSDVIELNLPSDASGFLLQDAQGDSVLSGKHVIMSKMRNRVA